MSIKTCTKQNAIKPAYERIPKEQKVSVSDRYFRVKIA
jgi:hypothetical protein